MVINYIYFDLLGLNERYGLLVLRSGSNNVKNISLSDLKINNIYPNPSNGNLRMSVSGLKGKELKIKIFNILGQEIESLSFNEMIKGRQFFDLNLNNLDCSFQSVYPD